MRALSIAISILVIGTGTAAAGTTVPATILEHTDAAGVVTHSVQAPPPTVAAGDVLVVTCPTSCDDLIVTVDGTVIKAKGTAATSPWTSPALASARVVLSYGTLNAPLFDDDGDDGGGGTLASSTCPSEIRRNEIAVDTNGNVLASKLDDFTEKDTLTVWAFGPQSTIDAIRIVRKSDLRDVTVLRILGKPEDATGALAKESGGEDLVCKRVVLTSFAAGRGAFAISTKDATIAELEFPVHPVYDGMFTVGFVGTWLPSRSFTQRDTGAIVQEPDGDAEGRYTLMYTAFLPLATWAGLRDHGWNQRIGLSAGVLLDDPSDNFLVGLNVGPMHGISIVAGMHAGRVRELDGVAVGDILPMDAEIPTTEGWDVAAFVGVSLDISVATKLFFSLFTN